jgi:lysophospholipase L1-like esterase
MNEQLAEVARTEKNVEFINLLPAFLDDQNQFRPELFVKDGIHFSPKGYAIVAGLLRGKF